MRTAGYDVGGAHLKVALVDNGRVVAARQIKCELWHGLAHLDAALEEAADLIASTDCHAVTMTGELTEIFDSRRAGVAAIVAHLSARLSPAPTFYSAPGRFISAIEAAQNTTSVASANFLATARLIATLKSNALLIDMGSTTTDIIACDHPLGLTDADRLRSGELVYTGLTRTLVPTVTTRAPFDGVWQSLARDGFATMADVRRVLENLPPDVDLHATSDGRSTSLIDSLARLARGFGRDGRLQELDLWQASAAHIRAVQLQSIVEGTKQVLADNRQAIDSVIAAGIGVDEACEIARILDLPALRFDELLAIDTALQPAVAACAPAVAIALLAERQRSLAV